MQSIAMAFLMTCSLAARAETYQCTNASGRAAFTDRAGPGCEPMSVKVVEPSAEEMQHAQARRRLGEEQEDERKAKEASEREARRQAAAEQQRQQAQQTRRQQGSSRATEPYIAPESYQEEPEERGRRSLLPPETD